ncbi:uncharacterized protein LOC123678406 [Harmonia axyridis]|uniref:uncharacterized protein LOC123678406 n=1 Tax=Harmonia axyridis TaxID=115357 RepID=UPI001E27845E|nr:uncharacterized protein LOC123678406 [Harmonia axyridis]
MNKNINDIRFISEIKKRPALWNQSKKGYSDRLKKNKNWEKLTKIFFGGNRTADEQKKLQKSLQQKWTNMRCQYRRYILNQRGQSGDDGKKNTFYRYADQLRFLKNTVIQKETTDNSKEVNIISSDSVVGEESTTSLTVTPRAKNALKKKTRSECSSKTIEKIKNRDNHDEIEDNRQFLLSLLPPLAHIPKRWNTKCRAEIMQVVSKYELDSHRTEPEPGDSMPQHSQPCDVPQAQPHYGFNTQ